MPARAETLEEEGKPVTAGALTTVESPARAEILEEEGKLVTEGTPATVESPATAETLEEDGNSNSRDANNKSKHASNS